MKIAILLGSIRIGRQSQKIAYYLQECLLARGLETDLIDLKLHPLPLLEERVQLHPQLPAEVRELGERLQAADALLLVSPEYHGSFSGVLKNALDYFRSEFHKKPIGVVATSGGKLGGINASLQLQQLVLHLGAFPLPLKLLVPEIQTQFDSNNQPLNPQIVATVEKYLGEFLWLAKAIEGAKKNQTKKELV